MNFPEQNSNLCCIQNDGKTFRVQDNIAKGMCLIAAYLQSLHGRRGELEIRNKVGEAIKIILMTNTVRN